MHVLNSPNNWRSHKDFKHWVKHALTPVALIMVFLVLPKPWTLTLLDSSQVMKLELVKPQTPPSNPPIMKPLQQQPVEPVPTPKKAPTPPTTKPPEKTSEKINKPKSEPVPKPESQHSVQAEPRQNKNISTGDVLQMIKNRTSIEVSAEFQARTGPARSFYIPEQEIQDWMNDIPYLDESVDKPKLQMKFYAEGLEGSIEKFFDKITISKTFTTKYGTKIHCALVGVLVACSWK